MAKMESTTSIATIRMAPARRQAILMRSLTPQKQGRVLLSLSDSQKCRLMGALSNKEVDLILHSLDPDKVTDLVQCLPEKRQQSVLDKLNQHTREEVEYLFQFDAKTAAGVMSLDYLLVGATTTMRGVARRIAEHEKRTGRLPVVLVHQKGELVGYLPGAAMVLAPAGHRVIKHVKPVSTVRHSTKPEEILELFHTHPHDKVVVVNDDGDVMGVIYADDILRLFQERRGEELYRFAGVEKEERVTDPAWTKVKFRYKWLLINLGTAFLAASVVGLFDDLIGRVTLLAAYMPVVAGMGGNAGTQTLAVTVRGIALKEISLATALRPIANEVLAGLSNGVLVGMIVAAVATFFNQSPWLGIVIGSAMVLNLVVAGFFGALVPLIMDKLGKDAATSATVFITTATDVCGFFTFLGLASIFLG